MVSFNDISQLSQPSTVKISSKDQQVLIQFSNVYGRSVRQRTGRQETTLAKACTPPSFCYDSTHSYAHVLLTQAMNESDREEQMEEKVRHENCRHMRKWRIKLAIRRRLEMKILLAKEFPEKISFSQEQTLNTAELSGSI